MSELESLAAEIRALGDESGRELRLAQSMAARYASLGQRLAGMGHLRGVDGLVPAYESLLRAYRKSEAAVSYLDALRMGAVTFADRLVGGGAGASGPNTAASGAPAAVGRGEQWVDGVNSSLKPSITYTAGENNYSYETDSHGRIIKASGELSMKPFRDRLAHQGATPGKLEGDHAGHIFADSLGGSPDLDNLTSQLASVNLSGFAEVEREWRRALSEEPPLRVQVDIEIEYAANGLRPERYLIFYEIDGEEFNAAFPNV